MRHALADAVLEWPHHLLTLAGWADLPENPRVRIEVVEEVPSVSPGPMWFQLCPEMSADAGIEHYWIVDLDPPVSMIADRLMDGDYALIDPCAQR
ncbi:hypothetical protein G3I59_42385 [Amycolatopsis rubida]|uniref:Uncharacterized protein n=1 Tax=Amycolatopsis rubida TaxID=112413 RepID=A0ABX0C2X7_9PSEU|nr:MULTISPECIES: hypothetical protein [Amycolatopsis]MYW97091.1 hypothetical protein [Amycolatopsis rubida]NEC62076.1 hypothetical protein [Amycolatopsis rubida]OAP27311.1 hypothetical protein A4R44_02121 [Amycolatopsis sp. M39]